MVEIRRSVIAVVCLLAVVLSSGSCSPAPSPESAPPATQTQQIEPGGEGSPGGAGAPDPDLELVDLCSLDPDLAGRTLRVVGVITYLDDQGAEGIYLDLENDGCQAGSTLPGDLPADQRALLALNGRIYLDGTLQIQDGEYFLIFSGLGSPPDLAAPPDPGRDWWSLPQTFHSGEGPTLDLIPQMNITTLHDWGSLLAGFAPNPDPYWTEASIRTRWEDAHSRGMRVEAVVSILDMFFVEYTPQDEIYDASAINLYGEHIQYDEPAGFIGCTNQEEWQEFTRQKIITAIDWGVDGIIIDDYEGSSRWTSGVPVGLGGLEYGPGGCFCPECEAGFQAYLGEIYSREELAGLGITDLESFDYSDYLLERGWTTDSLGRESAKFSGWQPGARVQAPLYQDYADFQNRQIAAFLASLKDEVLSYGRDTYGKELSWSVNAGELTYGTHSLIQTFDRSVGAIHPFGIPPRGSEGYFFRLFANLTGTSRLREFPGADPVIVGLLNEYGATNLWGLKGVEAYVNQGAVIEADYFIEEGADLDDEAAAQMNDPELKSAINTFYLENAGYFDLQENRSLARIAVLYSSPSIHYDLYLHLLTFQGVCEILTGLQVQFDPLFIGDGLSSPDNLTADLLSRYEVVFLPNLTALTASQREALLAYLDAGGSLVSLGKLGEQDQYGEAVQDQAFQGLLHSAPAEYGEGRFVSLVSPSLQIGGILDDELTNPAAFYYHYYVENDPVKAPFLGRIGETPGKDLSEDAAEGIRGMFSELLDGLLSSRLLAEELPAGIAVQAYLQEDPDWMLILHLVNYNYDLQEDRMRNQEALDLVMTVPDQQAVSSVRLQSPDLEGAINLEFTYIDGLLRFTVPSLHFWDLVVVSD